MDRNTFDSNEAMVQYARRLKAKRDELHKMRFDKRKRDRASKRWVLLRTALFVAVALASGAVVAGLFLAGVIV